MYNSVELDYRAVGILSQIGVASKCHASSEMTEFELAFLCGVISKKSPKKIVEIGVSAGGTSIVILKQLEILGLDTEMYSVDLLNYCYRDPKEKVGYLIEKAKQNGFIMHKSEVMVGGIARNIEKISENGKIDLLILDTTHALPGEVLDFIVTYPYLAPDAMVVLHDLNSNYLGDASNGFATKVLFDVIKADKYLQMDRNRPLGYSNIGAFQVNETTLNSITDVVSSLSITWSYTPQSELLNDYKCIVKKKYCDEIYDMFCSKLQAQELIKLKKMIINHRGGNTEILMKRWKSSKHVIIYGAGFWGKIYSRYAMLNGLHIDGFAISNDQNITESDIPIYHLIDVPFSPDDVSFVLAVGNEKRNDIEKNVLYANFYQII